MQLVKPKALHKNLKIIRMTNKTMKDESNNRKA